MPIRDSSSRNAADHYRKDQNNAFKWTDFAEIQFLSDTLLHVRYRESQVIEPYGGMEDPIQFDLKHTEAEIHHDGSIEDIAEMV